MHSYVLTVYCLKDCSRINLCVCVCGRGGGGWRGVWTAKKIFRWVELLFITDFRRLGGEQNYVFRWVMGLFSVLFIQNKKLLENGSNCPISCLDFYTSCIYVCRFCLNATSTNGVSFLVPLQNNSILG